MIFVSSKISDGDMKLLENRKRFFKELGINPKNVAEVKQVHGNKIIYVDTIPNPDTETDGLITNKAETYLLIKVADCIPLGLHDPKHNAIGLIHVGWQGLETGIIKNTVKEMKKHFSTNPKDLTTQFGPSIGPCHYRMDLWKETEDQLVSCGVLKKNIHNPKICTYESKDYFSHRRADDTNKKDSRFVTILGLENAN